MRKIKIYFAHCYNYLSTYDTFVYRKILLFSQAVHGECIAWTWNFLMECFKCAQTWLTASRKFPFMLWLTRQECKSCWISDICQRAEMSVTGRYCWLLSPHSPPGIAKTGLYILNRTHLIDLQTVFAEETICISVQTVKYEQHQYA